MLAIIGMVTGVFIIGAARLADQGPSTPYAVFWTASAAARKQALLSGGEVRLAFTPAVTGEGSDSPSGLTATWDGGGSQFFSFANMGDVTCDFLTTQKGASAILIAGELIETQTIPFMTYYGDGTCTPCRIQFRVNGSPEVIAIDPWTCAEMLKKPEDTR